MIHIWLNEDGEFKASWNPPAVGPYLRIEYEDERPELFFDDTDDELGVDS